MPTTVNILGEEDALTRSATSTINAASTGWTVSGGTLSIISTEFVNQNRYVLRLAPNTSGNVVLSLNAIGLLISDNSETLSFNARVKSGNAITVTARLSIDGEATPNGRDTEIAGGIYGAVQSNTVVVPDDNTTHSVSIQITISGHNSTNSYVTLTNLINDHAFYNNYFVFRSRNFLPDFYWEIDSAQSAPTAPLHRLIDILTSASDEVKKEADAIFEYEANELKSQEDSVLRFSQSVLTNPQYVRDRYMPWLNQFNGAALRRNIVDSDGDEYYENATTQRSFSVWQLENAYYGRSAGTREALVESTKRVLGITKNNQPSTYGVGLTPFFQNEQFFIRIQTLLNETKDVTSVGDSSQLVLNAIEPARPMGYRIFHTTVNSFAFTLNDIQLGSLGQIGLG